MIGGPYNRHRELHLAERTERVRDIDVRIVSVRYQRFLANYGVETVLDSNDFYTVHITRGGRYVHITWTEDGSVTSCGPLAHVRSACDLVRDLYALPPEAIR